MVTPDLILAVVLELLTGSLRRCLCIWRDLRLPLHDFVAEAESSGGSSICVEPDEIEELLVGTSVCRVDEVTRAGDMSTLPDFLGLPRLTIRNGLGVRSESSKSPLSLDLRGVNCEWDIVMSFQEPPTQVGAVCLAYMMRPIRSCSLKGAVRLNLT